MADECADCRIAVIHATLVSNGAKIDLLPEPIVEGSYRLSEGPKGRMARKLTPTEKLTTAWGAKLYAKHDCPQAKTSYYSRHRRTA
jgi:hypothetical protein